MLWGILQMKDDLYHIPVLLHAATNALINNLDGNYVDVTFGGGGHSKQILKLINNGKLLAFDQDSDSFINEIDDSRFKLVRQNFRNIQNVLEANKFGLCDGIIADLGVSSFQFDNSHRGFSFRFDSKLDMRMNKDSSLSAFDIINNYSENELVDLFLKFGEFKNIEAKRIALSIVKKRINTSIDTTAQLVHTIEHLFPVKLKNKFLARVFQSIRIEVNQELDALMDFLKQIPFCLKKNGSAVVITYHSLEDRLVKNFFKSGNFNGIAQKDFFGVESKPFTLENKKPIVPSFSEINSNPRARSAKLRIAKLN